MVRHRRPCQHVRRVRTKHGRQARVINAGRRRRSYAFLTQAQLERASRKSIPDMTTEEFEALEPLGYIVPRKKNFGMTAYAYPERGGYLEKYPATRRNQLITITKQSFKHARPKITTNVGYFDPLIERKVLHGEDTVTGRELLQFIDQRHPTGRKVNEIGFLQQYHTRTLANPERSHSHNPLWKTTTPVTADDKFGIEFAPGGGRAFDLIKLGGNV